VAGVGNTVLQGAIVGQQQQAFAIGVETAGSIDAGQRYMILQAHPAGSAVNWHSTP